MSNGAISTDYILNIPLTTIIKCHFSYSQPLSQATKTNIIISQIPNTIFLASDYGASGLLDPCTRVQILAAACENVTSDLGLARYSTLVFSGHHLQLTSHD